MINEKTHHFEGPTLFIEIDFDFEMSFDVFEFEICMRIVM